MCGGGAQELLAESCIHEERERKAEVAFPPQSQGRDSRSITCKVGGVCRKGDWCPLWQYDVSWLLHLLSHLCAPLAEKGIGEDGEGPAVRASSVNFPLINWVTGNVAKLELTSHEAGGPWRTVDGGGSRDGGRGRHTTASPVSWNGVEGRSQQNPSRNALMLNIKAPVLQRTQWLVTVREISSSNQGKRSCNPASLWLLPGPALEEPSQKGGPDVEGTLLHCAAGVKGFDRSLRLNSLID